MAYLEEAYCCFLEGDDDSHQAVTTEYTEARDEEDAGAEEFLRNLEEANEALGQTNQEVCFVSFVHVVCAMYFGDFHVRVPYRLACVS